jgi:leader peptidase (prepilin peptidase)/N-methyltransferase
VTRDEGDAGDAMLRQPRKVYALAAISAAAAAMASIAAAPNPRGFAGAGPALFAAAIAAIDARHFIIPDELNLGALALALINASIQHPDTAVGAIALAVARGGALWFLFLGLQTGYRWLRNREGLGSGDVKLAGVAGAWLGWSTISIAIEVAALAALGGYAAHRWVTGAALRPTSRLPFGLFVAPAIWFGWFLETLWSAP